MTERERKCLALIAARRLTGDPFPSLREIAVELGTKERTIAARTLKSLRQVYPLELK